MAAYIVATVRITDPVKFRAYGAAIDGLAQQFGGDYVARGSVIDGLEGEAAIGERVVILKFPAAQDARDFYNSETYQKAKLLRLEAADITMRLVEG